MWLWIGLCAGLLGALLLDWPRLRRKGAAKERLAAAAAWAAAAIGATLYGTLPEPPNPLQWIAVALHGYVDVFNSLFS
ncbi:hypothetical protein ACTHPH_07000 [Paenibacillus pasadenensis]|uniref:Uncharacterized protein n=1 Tax=Paenibacillus pasadenensis TaxID=217090 RepID=A0A2N5NA05_9BACL|nr:MULTISPECIES: hypothetical protein [Paenibacillus]PLT47163.1 hypothetical protein B8V81_1387 [Paenibacillus pasadenensis]QGG57487.1 hypothetical protein GE073_19040 [Paenibacillus sp. B01]